MTVIQRLILIVGGLLLLWFSFNTTFDQYGTGENRPWLATALFLGSVGLFYASAWRSRNP